MGVFDTILANTLRHEGGYANDPIDRGGETYCGISRRHWPSWTGWLIVDGLKERTDFPRCLSAHEDLHAAVKDFYWENKWVPARINELPEALRGVFFDMVVHHGKHGATKILQRTCNAAGQSIKVDGIIGPNTIGAAAHIDVGRVIAYRCLFFAEIIQKDASQERFWYGWFRRAVNFL